MWEKLRPEGQNVTSLSEIAELWQEQGGDENSLSRHVAIGDGVGGYPQEKQAPHMFPTHPKERRTSLSRDNRRATAYKKRAGRKVA